MKHFCTWLLAFAAVITLCAADAPAKKSPAKAKKTVRSAKVPRTSPAVPIAVKGEACGHIAIDLDAPRPVQLAARELQNYLRKITTARYAVQHNTTGKKTTIFILGCKDAPVIKPFLQGKLAQAVKKLKDDGYAVFRRGNRIIIVGNTPRGVLNGVHRFIFKHTDFIWVRPYKELAVYSVNPDLKLDVKDYIDNPKFKMRGWGANGNLAIRSEEYLMYVSRLGNNWAPGSSSDIVLGRQLDHGLIMEFGGGHNMSSRWLPKKKYGTTNPEYYMLVDGKRRTSGRVNLCYSNPEMIKTFIKETLAIAKALPKYYETINIMIDDTPTFCECPECEKPIKLADGSWLKKEDGAYKSTVFFLFLNQVARAVAKECPHLDIKCFGYFFTAVPPKVPVEKNIRISFCPYVRNDKETLFGASNAKWLKRTTEYAQKSSGLMWREYYYCSQKFPRAQANIIAPDLRYINKHGIRMIYSELSWGDRPDYPRRKTGFTEHDFFNMAGPEFWTINMLYWDCNQDPDALRNEYIKRTYREGAPGMLKFYKILRDSWVNDPTPAAFNDNYRTDMSHYVINKKLLEPCRAALKEAAASVRDPRSKEQIARVCATFESWVKQAAAVARVKQQVPKAVIRSFPGFDFNTGVWTKASTIKLSFMGKAAAFPEKEPTEVKLIHNGETLYVGFRCVAPGELSAEKNSRRDKWPAGDHVEMFISNEKDGYYQLAFNCFADGEKGISDSRGTDASWSCKWEARTQVLPGEWRAVAVIPLKSVNIAVERNNKVRALFFRARPARAGVAGDKTIRSSWGGGKVHSASSFGQLEFLHE